MADPSSASFVIQNISNPAAAATTVVAATPLTSGNRLGTGRYAVPTGLTGTWALGTHRVVVTYRLSASGPDLRQVLEFEVLSDVDWPGTGAEYRGYVSTRALYEDGYAVAGTDVVETLHRVVNKFSQRVEHWTAREFHPTFKSLYVAGMDTEYLLLREPIVALHDVYYTWMGSDNVEQAQLITRSSYHVRVRHLDGEIGRDSRILSMLELSSAWLGDGWSPRVGEGGHTWSDRSRNYRLDGVFGYTEGALDPAGLRADIGRTPAPLAEVVAVLVSRQLEDMTLSSPMGMVPGLIGTIRTRDQMIKIDSGSSLASMSTGGVFTGDPYLDMILSQYVAPTDVTPVGRSRASGADAGW